LTRSGARATATQLDISSDEAVAGDLAGLVAIVADDVNTRRDKAQNAYEILRSHWGFKKMRELGEAINNDGGLDRMRRVWYRVAAMDRNTHLLDMAWDGVGQWRR
jgi:hypothetical protein